jgi:cyanoexosortase A
MNIAIQLGKRAIHYLHRLATDPTSCWKALSLLQASLFIWLIQTSQDNPSLTLLALVVWGGAAVCIEDHLEHFEVCPSRSSLVAGTVLLAYASWRSTVVLDLDAIVYVLPLLQGLGLALLATPIRQLAKFKDALIVLSLLPLQPLLSKLLPEYGLSVVTGRVAEIVLLIFGVNASAAGRLLSLGQAGVRIEGECNGVELMAQLTVIAIVFVLAFPIRRVAIKLIYVAMAAALAFFVNATRIAILAVITGSNLPMRRALFDFLHEEWGSLVFAGVASALIGQIYLALINQELNSRYD